MENASKALIVAGAILIAILLISVSIMVINSTDNITSSVGDKMSIQEVEAFNSQFTSYSGEQKGSSIRTLMNEVSASNAQYAQDNINQITVQLGGAASTTSDVIAHVRASRTYTVEVTIDEAGTGLVNTINIVD